MNKFADATFAEDVLKSDKPVLVDFFADWCGPCRMMTPIIEKLAIEYSDRIVIGKLDTETDRKTAMTHKINMLPTLLFFKGGEMIQRETGLKTEAQLRAIIEKVIA